MTDHQHDSLVGEMRSLFRHAPLSAIDLLTNAPNLSRSLDPDPDAALVALWDVFDDFPGDKDVAAAAAMLGLTKSGNVLDRLVGFNEDKNPRTVRRWAYEGIDKVAMAIAKKRDIIFAACEVTVRGTPTGASVSYELFTNVTMAEPELVQHLHPQDLNDHIDESEPVGPHLEIPRGDWARWYVNINWSGEAVPMWGISCDLPNTDVASKVGWFSFGAVWET